MLFVWVYVCVFPFGLCYSYVLSFGVMLHLRSFELGLRLYGMEEERQTSHKGQGKSCGWKIGFSPPLPFSLAVESDGGYGELER
jgi:hypothetical protein